MSLKSIRAFSDPQYDYYKLTKDFGLLEKGTIFYHDNNDEEYGCSSGCLKNCWTPDGNTFGELTAGTVILHSRFKDTDMFKKVAPTLYDYIDALACGKYELTIHPDHTYKITKNGCSLDEFGKYL